MTTPSKPHTCFLKTYDALAHILGDVDFLGERRSFETAAKRFGEFRLLLEQHLRDEDDVLLPRFARVAPEKRAELEGIHANRARLLGCVNEVASTITAADFSAFCFAMAELDRALEAHRVAEEHVVHPALDRLLKNDADWENLCARVRFPHEPSPSTPTGRS